MSEEERSRIFAEEWLVETLTQPLLMKDVYKRQDNGRPKAFIGAAIGAVGNLVGGIIGKRKQKKAQELSLIHI